MDPKDSPTPARRAMSPKAKLAVEMGPLLVFFVTFFIAKKNMGDKDGMIFATGAFVVVTLLALAYAFVMERKLPVMTVVTAIIVTVMGGLTIYLDDETFIKRKPTYVSGFMGAVLLGGLAVGKPLVKKLFGSALQMDDAGWRKLTLRWGLFFLVLAAMNEFVWRRYSTETWITYKTFGILPLTFGFLLAQAPLIARHGGSLDGPQEGDPSQGQGPGE